MTGISVLANAGIPAEQAFDSELHLAVGMFDGVHIGHKAVIRQAIEAAKQAGGHRSGVLTFDPHPSRALYPEMATSLLFPLRQRIREMHATGIDLVFIQNFTKEYACRDAQEYAHRSPYCNRGKTRYPDFSNHPD